ncbi:hypothetical protein [Neobacillus sp.]|uniref:hypothetical protein n=1 Tax=Neobacillus sp. TaxID=2675273 RepID=UPI0028A1BF4B|nr:hypothetical protein [Neobacillus sp.]
MDSKDHKKNSIKVETVGEKIFTDNEKIPKTSSVLGGTSITGFVDIEKLIQIKDKPFHEKAIFLEKKLPFQILELELNSGCHEGMDDEDKSKIITVGKKIFTGNTEIPKTGSVLGGSSTTGFVDIEKLIRIKDKTSGKKRIFFLEKILPFQILELELESKCESKEWLSTSKKLTKNMKRLDELFPDNWHDKDHIKVTTVGQMIITENIEIPKSETVLGGTVLTGFVDIEKLIRVKDKRNRIFFLEKILPFQVLELELDNES